MSTPTALEGHTRQVIVTHGAWSAGWVWKKMRPRLAAHGVGLWTPTYTGVGERRHLAHAGLTLSDHIADVAAVIETEDLSDLTVIAHSYGGMVGTGVIDRLADRVHSIIYLDAFVPRSGQSLLDLVGDQGAEVMRARAAEGDGWRVAPNPPPPDTDAADLEWITPRRGDQPLGTFTEQLTLSGDTSHIDRSYIYCTRFGDQDVFRQFRDRAAADPTWRVRDIDASHNPHVTCPDELTDLLVELLELP